MNRLKTLKQKQDAERAIWEKLEVVPSDLNDHPNITAILIKSLGSIDKSIEFLRESDDKRVKAVLQKWDDTPARHKKILPFEAFCLAGGIKPKDMIGLITSLVVEHGTKASELMIAAAQPEVVQKTIKLAKTKGGYDERKVILQNRGVLPTPKNTVFNNFGSVDARRQIANVSIPQLEEDNDKIGRAVDKFNAQRQLKAPNEEGVDFVDVLAEE